MTNASDQTQATLDNVTRIPRPERRLEIMDLSTGEVLDLEAVQAAMSLATAAQLLELVERAAAELRLMRTELQERLLAELEAPPTKLTKLVAGDHLVSIDPGPPTWPQPILKALWADEELQREARQYLRVESVAPDLRRVRPLLEARVSEEETTPLARFIRTLQTHAGRGRPKVSLSRPGDDGGAR